jgi:predicted DNA-binding protein
MEKQTSMTKRTLFLPDELWAALGRLSTKTGAPIAELVRRAIIAYLKKEGESR